jgi:hypothetical protein
MSEKVNIPSPPLPARKTTNAEPTDAFEAWRNRMRRAGNICYRFLLDYSDEVKAARLALAGVNGLFEKNVLAERSHFYYCLLKLMSDCLVRTTPGELYSYLWTGLNVSDIQHLVGVDCIRCPETYMRSHAFGVHGNRLRWPNRSPSSFSLVFNAGTLSDTRQQRMH